jgi:AcrR family transcriptional regulator
VTASPGADVHGSDGAGASAPVFRRARPADALDLALDTFLQSTRLDMQTLAARLDVSPATLYRWFGSRARLLDGVLGRLAEQFAGAARAAAEGSGDDRVCDWARRLMTDASAFEPTRSFVEREPQLALRLLLGREGAVHRVLVGRTSEIIAEASDADEPPPEPVQLIVQVATALVWVTVMIGEEPQIDDAVALIRMILASGRPAAAAAG